MTDAEGRMSGDDRAGDRGDQENRGSEVDESGRRRRGEPGGGRGDRDALNPKEQDVLSTSECKGEERQPGVPPERQDGGDGKHDLPCRRPIDVEIGLVPRGGGEGSLQDGDIVPGPERHPGDGRGVEQEDVAVGPLTEPSKGPREPIQRSDP